MNLCLIFYVYSTDKEPFKAILNKSILNTDSL